MGERDYASETHSTMFIIGEKQDEEESDPSQLDQSESSVESAGNEDEQINDNKFDFAKKWREQLFFEKNVFFEIEKKKGFLKEKILEEKSRLRQVDGRWG